MCVTARFVCKCNFPDNHFSRPCTLIPHQKTFVSLYMNKKTQAKYSFRTIILQHIESVLIRVQQVIPVVIYCPEQGSNTKMPSTSVFMTPIRGLWTDLWLEKPWECFWTEVWYKQFGNYFSLTSEKRNIHKMNISHSCSWQVLFNVILWAIIPSAVRSITKCHSALLFNIPNKIMYVIHERLSQTNVLDFMCDPNWTQPLSWGW